jgi:hypothetical protein
MLKNERFNIILSEIEAKFGRGGSTNWINRDFEDLSFEIKKQTKVTISALTLKRIFGKIQTPDEYLPQKATLQALENYSGFTAKTQHQKSIVVAVVDDVKSESLISPELNPINPKKKYRFLFIVAITVLLISVLFVLFVPKETENKALSGTLKLIKTEGENPKTAFFEYTTPNTTDSIKILFDEEYPPVYVVNGNSQKTTYYFQYPGLFKVCMLNKSKVISDTIPVFVASKGWQALGYYFDQKYNERYFPIDFKKCCSSGFFHPTKQLLSATSLDTTKIAVIRIDNFRKTGKNGDSFTLETTFKNPEQWPGIRCNSIYLYIQGTEGKIRFRFANPGCSYWIDYQLSEKKVTNKDTDLSTFTFSLNDWQQFRLENRNKKVELFINNSRRFSDTYKKSIGEIVGVTVLFHGNGYIKDYLLKDNAGNVVFKFTP